MGFPNFEGIIVRPSGGRGKATSINLPGSYIESSKGNEKPRVEATTKNAAVGAASPYPFKIDISHQLRIHGATPPFEINLVNAEEITISSQKRDYDQSDPFITMDEHGIVTYSPRGLYVRNTLHLQIELADKNNPPTAFGQASGEVYKDNVDPRGTSRIPRIPIEDLETLNILVQFHNNVIGDGQKEAEFWQQQGMEPTCALAACAGVLASLGITDADGELMNYWTLLNQALTLTFPDRYATIKEYNLPPIPLYRAHGKHRILHEPNKPEIPQDLIHDSFEGEDEYYDILARGDVMQTREYFDRVTQTGELPSGHYAYLYEILNYRESPNYQGMVEVYPTNISNNSTSSGDSWVAIHIMLNANGVKTRTGSGAEVSTVIQELLAGNKVIVGVDATELAEKPELMDAQSQADRLALLNIGEDLDSGANHAVWLTEIDTSADPPTVTINDSARGGGIVMPLDQFLAAWGDADYLYVGTGDNPLPPEIVTQEAEIQRRYAEALEDEGYPEYYIDRISKVNSTSQLVQIDKRITDIVEKRFPGTEDLATSYLQNLQNNRQKILEEAGLDPDLLDDITETLDDSEPN